MIRPETPLAIAGIILSLLLSGCASASNDVDPAASADYSSEFEASTEAAGEAASAEIAVADVPAGFTDVGGIAAKISTTDNACSYLSCVFVEVYAYADCPAAVYVEGNQYDSATDMIYGITNGTAGALKVGDIAMLELTMTETSADSVQLTEANCY